MTDEMIQEETSVEVDTVEPVAPPSTIEANFDPNLQPRYTENDLNAISEQIYRQALEEAKSQTPPLVTNPYIAEDDDAEVRPLTLKDLELYEEQKAVKNQQEQHTQGLNFYRSQSIPNMINHLGISNDRDKEFINLKFGEIYVKNVGIHGLTPVAIKAAADEHTAWLAKNFTTQVTETNKMEQVSHSNKSGMIKPRPANEPVQDVKQLSLRERFKIFNEKK